MSPLVFRTLASGGWFLFAFLVYVMWPDLLKFGHSVNEQIPVDVAVMATLMLGVVGVIVHSLLADRVVIAPPVPRVGAGPQMPTPEEAARARTEAAASRGKGPVGGRSSARLAAVQAKFATPDPVAQDEGSSDLSAKIRELERAGELDQAISLARKVNDRPSLARLFMKKGQYLQALDLYVDIEDFEGAGMAATMKGDVSMAKAFYRQAALSLQKAGAVNPNVLASLWDRAGNASAAAAAYEAGGMLKKAAECFDAAGDLKNSQRCRQQHALTISDHTPFADEPGSLVEAARFLEKRGDPFGAAESYVEAGQFLEAARCYAAYEDWARAARNYELAGDSAQAEAMRSKSGITGTQGQAKPAAPPPPPPPPGPEKSTSPAPGFRPEPELPETPSREDLNRAVEAAGAPQSKTPTREELAAIAALEQTTVRRRPGVIAMEAAGIGVPEGTNTSTPPPPPAAPPQNLQDLDATQVRSADRPKPGQLRPAGVVGDLGVAPITLQPAPAGVGASTARLTAATLPTEPVGGFPGEFPTPVDYFTQPRPEPWKSGWPLVPPAPQAIDVPMFSAVIPGETTLASPPALVLHKDSDDDGSDTVRGLQPDELETTMEQIRSLAESGQFEKAAEIAIRIEAWGAAAHLLTEAGRYAEAADLWRRLGQWDDAVAALGQLGRSADAALLYLAAGRPARSVMLLRRALRRNPTDSSLGFLLARVLAAVGRPDLTLHLLRTILAPSGPGPDTAVSGFRVARILEEYDHHAEAHAVYRSLLEAGARNSELLARESALAHTLAKPVFNAAAALNQEESFNDLRTRIDTSSELVTQIEEMSALKTFCELPASRAVDYLLGAVPESRWTRAEGEMSGGIIPRVAPSSFMFDLPEDLAARPMEDTARRVSTSPLSVSMFGVPYAPVEPWTIPWRFEIRAEKRRLGREILFMAQDNAQNGNNTVALRLFGRGSVDVKGLKYVADRIRAIVAIPHPNLGAPLDMGVLDLRPYILERYLPAGSLENRLAEGGPMPLASALRVFVQLARALDVAHRNGVVHGFLHLGQILFDSRGEAVITGWALEIMRRGPGVLANHPQGAAGARPDIRALGILLYQMIAGHAPAARNPVQLHGVRPDVPESLGLIVEGCLGIDPRRRYHMVGEFLPAVEQLLTAL